MGGLHFVVFREHNCPGCLWSESSPQVAIRSCCEINLYLTVSSSETLLSKPYGLSVEGYSKVYIPKTVLCCFSHTLSPSLLANRWHFGLKGSGPFIGKVSEDRRRGASGSISRGLIGRTR